MRIELDSCPFCGSCEIVDHIIFKRKIIFIKCNFCNAHGPEINLDTECASVINSVESGLKSASILWNKRVGADDK